MEVWQFFKNESSFLFVFFFFVTFLVFMANDHFAIGTELGAKMLSLKLRMYMFCFVSLPQALIQF